MKKIMAIFSLLIFSCSTTSNYYTFDNALEMGTEKIQNDLPAGADVAILDFKSDNENLSAYVIEEMYDKLINFGKLSIMERSRIKTIAMEIGYQLSGEVDDNEIINIGHQLGADYVVTGQIVFSGEAYRLRVFAIDIVEGRRVASSSLNINPNDKEINYLLATKATSKTTVAETTEPPAPTPAPQPAPVVPPRPPPAPAPVVPPVEPPRPVQPPAASPEKPAPVTPTPAPPKEKKEWEYDPDRLNTLGVSAGIGLFPAFTATVRGTIAPWSYGFFDLGMDIGMGHWWADEVKDYFSLHPYVHYAVFLDPYFLGLGVGFENATSTDKIKYSVYGKDGKWEQQERWETSTDNCLTVGYSAGWYFENGFTISLDGWFAILNADGNWGYFPRASGLKLAIGYSYRFKGKAKER